MKDKHPQFGEGIEILPYAPYYAEPGRYMMKDGQWVKWDGSDVSQLMVIEYKTAGELKLSQPPTNKEEHVKD